ncbi:hypothetical protein QFZ55_000643 [Streptomyces luteogriseus]|uniref:hypothetical protein n=1 Tax=Streptomyces luteogriseus TaxID=68233 RepID=UPI0027884E5A|nr:hypothetical protein [Streptomyces luteogriseus]MDQ0711191.1 hypothetical protein [Streptomyces luteogriseus]
MVYVDGGNGIIAAYRRRGRRSAMRRHGVDAHIRSSEDHTCGRAGTERGDTRTQSPADTERGDTRTQSPADTERGDRRTQSPADTGCGHALTASRATVSTRAAPHIDHGSVHDRKAEVLR